MGGVLRYNLEVHRQHFSDKQYGLGAPEQCPLPSPKLSLKNAFQFASPPHNRGLCFSSFKIAPRGEGEDYCSAIQLLSGKSCLAAIFASRHLDASPGPLGIRASRLPSIANPQNPAILKRIRVIVIHFNGSKF